jgi:hypothetical protein
MLASSTCVVMQQEYVPADVQAGVGMLLFKAVSA